MSRVRGGGCKAEAQIPAGLSGPRDLETSDVKKNTNCKEGADFFPLFLGPYYCSFFSRPSYIETWRKIPQIQKLHQLVINNIWILLPYPLDLGIPRAMRRVQFRPGDIYPRVSPLAVTDG